jgi:LysR family nitrogen assimilation transcriptional regulator
VKRGLGYTVLTMAAVQDDVARGEVYAYPIMRPPLTNSLSIVVLRDTKSSRFVAPLTRHLEKIMRDLVAKGTWQGAVTRR